MEPERYLTSLRSDADVLAETARRDLTGRVPSCPHWSVEDLVVHVLQVYRHKTACIRLGHNPDPWPPPVPPGHPVDAMQAAVAELTAELVERGPGAPSYTWHEPDQTVGFWYRRMAQETAVHRVDAELAFGPPGPIDADIATDGVAEVLDIMLAGDWSDLAQPGPIRTVLLEAGGSTWLVRMTPTEVAVSTMQDAAAVDATLTGDPDALLLWLWGRQDLAALRVDGDPAAARALRTRLELVTQ